MFQNTSNEPIHLKKGQILGKAISGATGYIANTSMEIDWSDMIQPGARNRSLGSTAPRLISTNFYKWPTETLPNLMQQLDLLANTVHYTEKDTPLPSEILTFNAIGKELPGPQPSIKEHLPHTISESELLKKVASAPYRLPNEQRNAENEDEVPPFTPIPDRKPSDPVEEITEDNIHMGRGLTREQQQELLTLVMQYRAVFGKGGRIRLVKGYKVTVNTDDNALPTAQHPHPAGPEKRSLIEKTMDQLIAWDIIEPSISETASPVVLVWQNNKWRLCVDFRQLNSITIGDAYPMLRSDYVFSTLAGSKYFTLLDALKGYHQVEIEEADREKTAFISHKGLYQYKRLPFGLKNAPAQFQRLMDKIIGGLRWQAALVYIDDLLVYSANWRDHLHHLEIIMKSARDAGLVFSLEKCSFGFSDVKLLGHGLSRYGLHTLSEKVMSITSLAPGKTMGELHCLLGMFRYYRAFIHQFAKIARP